MKPISPDLESNMRSSPAWQNPEARAAIEAALPKIREAEVSDNQEEVNRLIEALNDELKRILEDLSSTPTPLTGEDAKRWCETLLEDPDHGYDIAKDTVNIVLESSKGEVCPSKEQVKAALFKTLTAEQVVELKKLREPTLLIVPDTTAARFQVAVDRPACKIMPGQQDAHFDDENFYTNALLAIAAQNSVPNDQSKITKYRFVITEGRQHFAAQESDPDFAWNNGAYMKIIDRFVKFEAYLKSHPGLVSQNTAIYMMLMIRGLKQGKPTDRISRTEGQYTMLPGEPRGAHVKDGLVAHGSWHGDETQAFFGYTNFIIPTDNQARLRAAVMGEIS